MHINWHVLKNLLRLQFWILKATFILVINYEKLCFWGKNLRKTVLFVSNKNFIHQNYSSTKDYDELRWQHFDNLFLFYVSVYLQFLLIVTDFHSFFRVHMYSSQFIVLNRFTYTILICNTKFLLLSLKNWYTQQINGWFPELLK